LPFRIEFIYQSIFLGPAPFFEFFFSFYGEIDVGIMLKINQVIAIIFAGECVWVAFVFLVLTNAPGEVVGHTNIQYGFSWIGDDINVKVVIVITHGEVLG
jgi:hypothetical protein